MYKYAVALMKVVDLVQRVGLETTTLAFRVNVLTLTLTADRFTILITLSTPTCPYGSLPERSVQSIHRFYMYVYTYMYICSHVYMYMCSSFKRKKFSKITKCRQHNCTDVNLEVSSLKKETSIAYIYVLYNELWEHKQSIGHLTDKPSLTGYRLRRLHRC